MKKSMKRFLAILLASLMLGATGMVAFADVFPYQKPVTIELSSNSINMTYGGKAQLNAKVLPEGSDSAVIYKSSDPFLVTVDAYGELTAAKDSAMPDKLSGKKTATITVTSQKDRNVTATCNVTVDNATSDKISYAFKQILNTVKQIFETLAKSIDVNAIKAFFNDLVKNLGGSKEG